MILAIDIGSNTTKCLLGQTDLNGTVERIYDKSLDRRILASGGNLVPNATDVISDSISFFQQEASLYSKEFAVIVVATSALRDCQYRKEIVKSVLEKTSQKIKILSGEEEAKLSFKGAMTDPFVNSNQRCAYFDLGGGSLEITSGINGVVDFAKSIPIGAVRLTNECSTSVEYSEFAKNEIVKSLFNFPKSQLLVGAGGAVVAARFMKKKLGIAGAENIISLDEMRQFFDIVSNLDLDARIENFSISPNRADIIPAAFACIIELMDFLKVSQLTHTFCNLRYGIIASNGNF